MNNNFQINDTLEDIQFIKKISEQLIKILPSFNIADRKILPYGLKPHTRSVAWIVEQVVVQQTKFNRSILNITNVNFDLPDTCLHDFEIYANNKVYYINVKAHQARSDKKKNKNDICAVEKIYTQYTANPNYNLYYLCVGINFDDVTINFENDETIVFSAQFLPIYVNPRNDKIQAYYNHNVTIRSRNEFLNLLV